MFLSWMKQSNLNLTHNVISGWPGAWRLRCCRNLAVCDSTSTHIVPEMAKADREHIISTLVSVGSQPRYT